MLYFTLLNRILFSLFYLWQMLYLFALLTARKTTFSFCKCSAKVAFSKNRTGIWSFLYYQGIWYFFPENMILFFRRNMKDDLYWYRRYFFFLQIWYYLSVKKAKMIFSRQSALKNDFSGKIEKDDIHPRKLVILLIEKLKMIQKFTFIKKFQKFFVLL